RSVRTSFGPLKVREIHVGRIKHLLRQKRDGGYSTNMVRLMRATLSVILGDAVESGLLSRNPVSQLSRRRKRAPGQLMKAERQEKVRPLNASQLQLVLSQAAVQEARLYPYLLLLARSGLRPSEGLGLHWDDLDCANRDRVIHF